MKTKIVPIDKFGKCKIDSPFVDKRGVCFISEQDSVICSVHKKEVLSEIQNNHLNFFELSGPRRKIYYNPKEITCGIVTCGGLCPGINDVIRGLVVELYGGYGVKNVLGFRYGYRGLTSKSKFRPVRLNPDNVDEIHTRGGTILSSSRGPQDVVDMVNTLLKYNIKILFTIGGDGTMRGAKFIVNYLKKINQDISVIAIPKTIDNDINYIDQSFGFETAVEKCKEVIESAHEESKGAPNGIGLVKVMGRSAGYIASYTTLANRNVNFCLIPEVPFKLHGKGGFLEVLKHRLHRKHHVVIVVAEGAGQNLMDTNVPTQKDLSGNVKLKDIGSFLEQEIKAYFNEIDTEVNIKYIDPSYIIRSVPANAMDSAYCLILAQSAVHAGMAGRTNMFVSSLNNHYIHLPIKMAISKSRQVNQNGRLWRTVMESTLQPYSIFK